MAPKKKKKRLRRICVLGALRDAKMSFARLSPDAIWLHFQNAIENAFKIDRERTWKMKPTCFAENGVEFCRNSSKINAKCRTEKYVGNYENICFLFEV